MIDAATKALTKEIKQNPVYMALIVTGALSLVFLIVPAIDLWVSNLFFSETHGFWAKQSWFFQRLRRMGILWPRLIIIGLVLFLIARLFWPHLRKAVSIAHALILTGTVLMGTGLLVNLVLKDHWGRARPIQTDVFGGQWPFSEVWLIAGNCEKNCSFVSGEGSMSFWLFGLLFLLPLAWRKMSFWIILVFASLFSLNRIAFGGHYLSDILLSWSLTALVMALLYHLFSDKSPLGWTPERLETAWDRAGAWLCSKWSPPS